MKISENTNQTKGIEIFVSAIKKHRVVAISYVVLQCLSFIILIFNSPLPLRIILSILTLLLPIGIALTLFLDKEKDTNIVKNVIAAGFIGVFINSLNSLYVQINIMTSTLFVNYEFLHRLATYANLVNAIVILCISILFLIMIFSNSNNTRMMGVLLIILVIGSLGLSIISYVSVFSTMNGSDFQQVPSDFRFRLIINWIKAGLGILSTLFWITIELLIAQTLLKSR